MRAFGNMIKFQRINIKITNNAKSSVPNVFHYKKSNETNAFTPTTSQQEDSNSQPLFRSEDSEQFENIGYFQKKKTHPHIQPLASSGTCSIDSPSGPAARSTYLLTPSGKFVFPRPGETFVVYIQDLLPVSE